MACPYCPNPRLSGKGDSFRGGLVVASNREPFSHRRCGRGLRLEIPTGGLVSALDAVLRVTGGTWVAWGSGSGDRKGADEKDRLWVQPSCPAYRLRRVWLSPDSQKNYYRGFCNSALWPLFHGEPERIRIRERYWDEYRKANLLFAEAILREADEDSTVWLHDYHLCLAPAILRSENPRRTIAHFWHVPWPDPDIFSHAPHGEELIAGLLGNDLIGFQIPSHAENFLKCAESCPEASVDHDAMTVSRQGRITRVRAFPISIDFHRFDAISASAETSEMVTEIRSKHRLPGLVGLAADRLDYTKGIVQRLDALDIFFRRYPVFIGSFTFVQIAVMTRNCLPYRSYRREVEERIAAINGKYGTSEWQPVLYLGNKLEQEVLAAWYRLADVAIITPLRDGMNLVAKEYVASRCGDTGALILGREAGAAAELKDAIQVDPFDAGTFASAIHRALTMPEREKRERMAALRDTVRKNTVFHWVGDILDELSLIPAVKRGARHALSNTKEIRERLAGKDLLLCLDFDGTLAPIVESPETAAMPDTIRALIEILRERYPIAVISGRSLGDLRRRVNVTGLIYGGNHGAEMDGVAPSEAGRRLLADFLEAAHGAFATFPGVQIEDKEVTASIHFRKVNPAVLDRFSSLFREIAGVYKERLLISEGRKVFEIRPPSAFTKGDAVIRLMQGVGAGRIPVYMGDDSSDEDGFRAVRGTGIAVSVGGSPEAEYYLRNQEEVSEFLALLAGIPRPDDK